MVASQFLEYLGKFKATNFVGVEDFADKFNFLFTKIILLLCLIIITVKTYLLKPISCYIATPIEGKNVAEYVENICWVEGTFPFSVFKELPQNVNDWDSKSDLKILYYQWVPFVLALQCILFYIPRIIWQTITYNRTGTDLENMVDMSLQASKDSPVARADKINHIVKQLEELLFKYRDFRSGKVANLRRKMYNACSFLTIGKKMGTWLFTMYIATKILYLLNAIGQLFLMQKFLGFERTNITSSNFGYELLKNILGGADWHQTMIFPRVTFCNVQIKHIGGVNSMAAQCALPINMLNEKIFIFLWFWILFAAILMALSIPLWVLKIVNGKSKVNFIKKFLLMSEHYSTKDKVLIKTFSQQFLRHDGIFLLKMISLNAGELVTYDIIIELWKTWRDNYQKRDFRKDICYEYKNSLITQDSSLSKRSTPGNNSPSSKQPFFGGDSN